MGMDANEISNELNTLGAEVEIMDMLTDDDLITLISTKWESGEVICLTREDVQVLIDLRVEKMNELEHELRNLEN